MLSEAEASIPPASVADSSTPLRSAQNDSAHLTFDLEVTHDVAKYRRVYRLSID